MIGFQRFGLGLVTMVGAACLQTGCLNGQGGQRPLPSPNSESFEQMVSDSGPLPFDQNRVRSNNPTDVRVRLLFDVERFIVPCDQSDEQRAAVWRYVDELRVSPDRAESLSANGLRMGVAEQRRFAAVREALAELNSRRERSSQIVQSGVPLTLDLGSLSGSRTVYLFDASGGLSGETFENATRRLTLDYDVGLQGSTPRISLRLTPELYKTSERPLFESVEGQVSYRQRYEGKKFHGLAVEMSIVQGDALVIGPANALERRFSLGSTLLTEESAGRCWETIFCITPVLFQSSPQPGG